MEDDLQSILDRNARTFDIASFFPTIGVFNDVCTGLVYGQLDGIYLVIVECSSFGGLLDKITDLLEAVEPARKFSGRHSIQKLPTAVVMSSKTLKYVSIPTNFNESWMP